MSTIFDSVIVILSLWKGLTYYGDLNRGDRSGTSSQFGATSRGVLGAMKWKGGPGTLIEILIRDSMLYPIM